MGIAQWADGGYFLGTFRTTTIGRCPISCKNLQAAIGNAWKP